MISYKVQFDICCCCCWGLLPPPLRRPLHVFLGWGELLVFHGEPPCCHVWLKANRRLEWCSGIGQDLGPGDSMEMSLPLLLWHLAAFPLPGSMCWPLLFLLPGLEKEEGTGTGRKCGDDEWDTLARPTLLLHTSTLSGEREEEVTFSKLEAIYRGD